MIYRITERDTGVVVCETYDYTLAEAIIRIQKNVSMSMNRMANKICWDASISGDKDLYDLADRVRREYSAYGSKLYIQNG